MIVSNTVENCRSATRDKVPLAAKGFAINNKGFRAAVHSMLAKRVQSIEITNVIGFPGWPELNLD